MEKMTSIKKDSLKFMRDYYRVSLSDVCDRTKIKIENLQKFESGEDYPSYSQLEKLADYYNKPVFFFFSKEISEPAEIQSDFRRIEQRYGDGLSKPTRELIEKADTYRINLNELYDDEECQIFSEMIQGCKTNRELSERLRKLLALTLDDQGKFTKSEDLLEYLRKKFYELGVYVFKDSFKNDSISGLCIYDEVFPIVLLNNKTSFKRQIFTLLHEVYHLFLKEADIDYTDGIEESECNKFASEFLIPQNDLLAQIGRIDDIEEIQELERLAKRYNVSRDAIMYRLVKMGKLDWEFYRHNCVGNFREQSGASGGNFYFTKMSYLGNSYLNKVFKSYYSGKLSKTQVGVYTGLKSMHVSKLASKMIGGTL